MGKIFYNQDRLILRRQFRNNGTEAEIFLWKALRSKHLVFKFRRQASIGRYVVDFYCPRGKLVLEVDGDVHSTVDAEAYDHERDHYLTCLGLKVVRFSNKDVLENIEEVLKQVKVILNSRISCLSPLAEGEIKRGSRFEDDKKGSRSEQSKKGSRSEEAKSGSQSENVASKSHVIKL